MNNNVTIPSGMTVARFQNEYTKYCFKVRIYGDNLTELDESFTVIMEAFQDEVIGSNVYTIYLEDDGDGKGLQFINQLLCFETVCILVNRCRRFISSVKTVNIIVTGYRLGSVAVLTCKTNYWISVNVTCSEEGWIGNEINCSKL